MSDTVAIGRRAQSTLRRVPQGDDERLRQALRGLGEPPRPPGCRKLSGRPGWRIRDADYRVIYEINDETQTVQGLDVGHRRDVYR